MYYGKGFLIRSLRVATYLVSRGWYMRDELDCIETSSTKEIEKYLRYLSMENGVRMFPPKTWPRKKAENAVRHAMANRKSGVQFDPPVMARTFMTGNVDD